MYKQFKNVAMNENNPKWKKAIERDGYLYSRENDIRSDFARDYTRILHSESYRRLKHKTQVFFQTQNDLVCTRIEHVNHVESVSTTIADRLGLNTELTSAIAIGHDLGHAPFGHEGERILNELSEQYLNEKFWHEKNGLRMVDVLDLLEDPRRNLQNLNLTYAVRDGIISHCGEVDDSVLTPRDSSMKFSDFEQGSTSPFTWEGCVVKLADKIAYVGRDIEDAKRLKILTFKQLLQLKDISKKYGLKTINTTTIIHDLILDVCSNSRPDIGLKISQGNAELLCEIKKFNEDNIYKNSRLLVYKEYVKLVIHSIFHILEQAYNGPETLRYIRQMKCYPLLSQSFSEWVAQRVDLDLSFFKWSKGIQKRCDNKKIYGELDKKETYLQAIIDYISCMTDGFAISIFNELCKF